MHKIGSILKIKRIVNHREVKEHPGYLLNFLEDKKFINQKVKVVDGAGVFANRPFVKVEFLNKGFDPYTQHQWYFHEDCFILDSSINLFISRRPKNVPEKD